MLAYPIVSSLAEKKNDEAEKLLRRKVEESPLRFLIRHYKGNHLAPTENSLERPLDFNNRILEEGEYAFD